MLDTIKAAVCLAFFAFCECAGLLLVSAACGLLQYAGLTRLVFPVWFFGVPVVFVSALVFSFLLANRLGRGCSR
jgi:hypothetical protein